MTALSSLLQKSFNALDLAHFISFFSAHHILFAMLRLLNRRCWIVSNCLDSDVHIPSHILGLPKYSQIKYINFFRLFPCLVLFRLYPRTLTIWRSELQIQQRFGRDTNKMLWFATFLRPKQKQAVQFAFTVRTPLYFRFQTRRQTKLND